MFGVKPVGFDRSTEKGIFEFVNDIRYRRGMNSLLENSTLSDVARAYSRRMKEERFFDHVDPSGGDTMSRVRATGVRFRMLAENIFMSQNHPDPILSAVHGWMRSDGHRANILTPDFTETGVGAWRDGPIFYVTQIYCLPI